MGLLLFPLVLMNRLNKTEYAFFLYCRFSISEGSIFPVYLEVVAAVVVLRRDGKTYPCTSIQCCYFFSYSCLSGILCSDGK